MAVERVSGFSVASERRVLLIFLVQSTASGAPAIWDPLSVLGSSVREATIFRAAKEGVAWPSWGRGSRAQGEAQRLTHAAQRGQQKVSRNISVSGFAARLDCSGTHARTHVASGGARGTFSSPRGLV